jgi:Arc/MetJ-type ribon-helix-helix transcriptional regulator
MKAVEDRGLVVPVRVSGELAVKLDRAVSNLHYSSRNAFIREAIEQHINDRLESRIIEVRDVPVGEAVRMIDRYLAKNPGAHYVSELAEELGLELGLAFKAAKALEESGAVRAKTR